MVDSYKKPTLREKYSVKIKYKQSWFKNDFMLTILSQFLPKKILHWAHYGFKYLSTLKISNCLF